MRAQLQTQGRHLGGRPPYGYTLVDAGPHPNKAHARWGRRLQRLEPDPVTAPVVRWIFDQRLAGSSITAIARDLNAQQTACPSAADPARNTHRARHTWGWTTVAAILANPRYTGRQAWNRQHSEFGDPNVDDPLGRSQIRRCNSLQDCVLSAGPAHPAIVTEQEYIAAQSIRLPTGVAQPERNYLLTGHLICQICERLLEAHWVHGHAGYRCRHGHHSTNERSDIPKNVYAREDQALLLLANRLPGLDAEMMGDLKDVVIPAYLAVHEVIIRCGRYTWQLEVDGEVIYDGWPPRLARVHNGRRRRRKARDAAL